MPEADDEGREPDRAKAIQDIPPVRPDETPPQKSMTGDQKRAAVRDKARRATRRRAGKVRYE